MQLVCSIYVGLLFFVLTPGILLSLPKRGSKYMVAATHALVFAVIYYFTHRMVWRIEGFAAVSNTASGTVIAPTFAGRPKLIAVAGEACKTVSGIVTARYDDKGICVATAINTPIKVVGGACKTVSGNVVAKYNANLNCVPINLTGS